MKKTLTVFTPAYNRAHTLPRLYKSLCRQTCQDFEWLIIDDGSKDNTAALVKQWIEEGLIPIRYVWQENQGMHGAHNTAYKNITTELNTCIDSDDWMPIDAVEKIISFWESHKSNNVAGIIGLDSYENGKIIGSRFPEDLLNTTLRGYYEDYGGNGDKKLVYRTEIIKQYAEYPIFKNERYVGLAYKYYLVDVDFPLIPLNEVLVIVDYQDDGSSRSMWKQYWNNPKGFAFFRRFDMQQTKSAKRKWKDNIHYVSHSIRAHNLHFISESPMKGMTILSIIPGCILFFVNKYKVKKGKLFS